MAESETTHDKTLLTLCKCRNILLNKLRSESLKSFDQNKELCEQFECDNKQLLNILYKLRMAKENLNPVIQEIIGSASKISKDDYKSLKGQNDPICSVTTAQFAGAIEASKLLYEINAALNEHGNNVKKQANQQQSENEKAEFAVNAFVYPQTTIVPSNTERIFIDKDLMQQLIELHDLLGDTIHRLKVRSGDTSGMYSTRTPSAKSSKKSYCCKKTESKKRMQNRPISPQQSYQTTRPQSPSPRMSRTLITGDPNKMSSGSKTSLRATERKSPLCSKTDISLKKTESLRMNTYEPYQTRNITIAPEERETKQKKKKCCPKKTKSEVDGKKKAKQEAKMKKKMEKQRKKEMKKREKAAKKSMKHKKSKGYTCFKKKKSQSATYVREGTPSNVSNIDEAKQKIMDCLNELSNIRTFLKTTASTELDMENQLEIVGSVAKGRDCCDRNFPHIHATLNGIPVVLQLNKETLSIIMKSSRSKATSSKCKCGPVELDKCPLAVKTDLDLTPVSHKSSKTSLKMSMSKTKSLPTVASKGSAQKSPSIQQFKKTSKETVSSSVLWKSPHTLGDIMSSSLTEAEILTTPETSITVFSTKKTKDGQKVRLSLTISPIGATKVETKTSAKGKVSTKTSLHYETKYVIPEKDSSSQKTKTDTSFYRSTKRDGFETDESDPGMPYIADNTSLPNFTTEEQKTRTTLTDTGICHPNQIIQKELEEMGIDNILKICRPAKCCRKTVINEKPRNALPYPASLMSLPLDKDDIIRIKADVRRTTSNSKFINYSKYQTFNFETYTKFQRNDKLLPWKIQTTFEVRFFEIFKMDKKPAPYVNNTKRYASRPQKRHVPPKTNTQSSTIKPNTPFYKNVPGFSFNIRLFDMLRRKQFKNSDSQTIDSDNESDNIKILIPTKHKNNVYHPRTSNIKMNNRNRTSTGFSKSFGIEDIPRKSVFPYKHEDIACFRADKLLHKVHFQPPVPLDATLCEPITKTSSSEKKDLPTNAKRTDENKAANDDVVKNKEDSLIKLIPLQPYLVEKVLEDKTKTNNDGSKSTVYNPSVNTVDSRIIYKKHQSEDLYYITSKTFDKPEKKKQNETSYTSMYKNSIFYPFKPPEYVTYYNTVHTDETKSNSPYTYSFKINSNKPCDCKNITSIHAPESLEDLMIDGKVPCLCSQCDITCRETRHNTKLYNKLVVVDSNKSLDDIDRRNKRTIIKSGKSKDHKGHNSKLVGRRSSEHMHNRKIKVDQKVNTFDEECNLKSKRCAARAKVQSKMNLDAYCTTSNESKTPNVAKRPKYNIVKEAATSKQSFNSSDHQYKLRHSGYELYALEKDSSSKPSFHFQCEDENNSNVKVTKKTNLTSRLPVVQKKRNNIHDGTTARDKRYSTRNELPITHNCYKNIMNYVTPRDDKTANLLQQIAKSDVPHTPKKELETKIGIRDNTLNERHPANRLTPDLYLVESGYTKSDSFCAPLKNKNVILNAKCNANRIAQRKTNGNKLSSKVIDTNNKEDDVSGFNKMIENLKKDLSLNAFQVKTITDNMNKPTERSVKHTFSAYNADVDGVTRPGYLSILKPTCGCPEITVFIPCYCDDNTIFGKEKKP